MSNAPVTTDKFMQTAVTLCEKIHAAGAVPVMYLTWAYHKEGKQLQKSGLNYDEMYRGLQKAYRMAAEKGNALVADVGTAFYERSPQEDLYVDDGSHPNEAGSHLTAQIIADCIMNTKK